MAELGQAELVLTANTQQLEKALAKVRDDLAALDTRPIKLRIDTSGSQGLNNVQSQLRNISTEADRAAVRVQSLNQVLNQAPGATYTRISAQIARLTSESRQLATSSGDYLKVLQRIVELESIRANRVGRQQVNAQFEAFNSPTLTTGFGAQDRLPSLPNTIAADQQLITELTQRLQNLDRNSGAYGQTLVELKQAQERVRDALRGTTASYRELEQAEERSIRRAEKLRDLQAYFADKNPRAGGVRDENGAIRARGRGSALSEFEYNQSIRPAQGLLELDLRRVRALREATERLKEQRALLESISSEGGGFGSSSASNFGTSDPIQKSIRRNAEKVAAQEERAAAQRSIFEQDLAAVTARRVASEEQVVQQEAKLAAAQKAEADAIRKSTAATKAEERARRDAATKRKAEGAKRRNEIVGNALIGGAFPALFGQGLGASAGGALGGGLGGAIGGNFGFGLSLIGTALGQAVDTALQQFADLGAAIDAPAKNFSALQQAAVLSSRGLERTVEGLIAAGRYGEANAVIQADLVATFGDLSAAENYRDQVDQLNRAWAQASVSTASFIAGPLAELIKRLRLSIGGTPNNEKERQFQEQSRRNTADTFTKAGLLVGSIGGVAALTPGAQLPGLATLGIGGLLTGIGRAFGEGGNNPANEDLTPLVEATNRIVEARARSVDLAKAERQQIVAQIQGNRDAADAAERVAAAGRRDEAIAADPTQAQAAWLEYEKTIVGVNERQKQREKELTATTAQEVLKRQQIAQQIGVAAARRDAALAAGDSAASPGNSTLAARAGQLEGASFLAQNRLRVEQAITRERELQAQLGQESDPTKRSQLAEQLKTAADEVRLAGEEAGAALAERAASAAQSLRSAQDSLRSTLQGNFRLLPGAQRQSLLAQAQADVERGRNTGIIRDTFRTGSRRRLFETADFIRNVEQQTAQVAQQQALVDALNQNTNAERNIRINVTMNADGTFNVNQTEQQAALL